MSWPTPQDYNEAIQNPSLAFRDPELHTGRPELNPLGLPRPISGAFATVYKLQCPQRTWAVRCFLRSFDDHERRYAAINDHLSKVRPPYTVEFAFQREGIRVGGQWYPLLKMEWVQGERLDEFIEKHLGNRDTLLSLAHRWVEMVKALRDASIAHGDLQHGNVLVANEELRLVDYDGMYVPALSGEGSHEVGHPNYQHPLRTGADFGPDLDNFSAWVVYISLIALAVDPGLWRRFSGGDECLLFRRRDFEQPEASDVLRSLERHHHEAIRSAAKLFRSLLYLRPQAVPSLDGRILPPTVSPATAPPASLSWIEDHVRPPAPAPAMDTTRGGYGGDNLTVPIPSGPSWILDALMPHPSAVVSFRTSAIPERIVFAISAILIPWLFLTVAGPDLWPLSIFSLMLLNLTLWVHRYRSDASVREFIGLASQVRALQSRIRVIERDIQAAERDKAALQTDNAAQRAHLAKEQKALEANEKKEVNKCQADLQSILSSIAKRRRLVNTQQANALQRIQKDIEAKVADLSRQIAALNQEETSELNRTLKARQQQHITDFLRRFSLERAHIPGIGPAFKERLIGWGFHTAADIDFYRVQRVHGIGQTRARYLVNWRRRLETQARTTMPSALPHNEAATIRARYEGRRRTLEQQRDSEQQRQRREEDNIRAQYRSLLEQLDQEEKGSHAKIQLAISEVSARYAQQYHAVREREAELAHNTASKLREIDERIAEARRKLFSLHWEKEKAGRQLRPYVKIRFPNYVKRVFFASRAA